MTRHDYSDDAVTAPTASSALRQSANVTARIPEGHQPEWQPSSILPNASEVGGLPVMVEGPQSTDNISASSQAGFFSYENDSLAMSFAPEDAEFAIDSSAPSFDLNQRGTSTFEVDLNGLDWSLLNSFSFEYSHDQWQHHTFPANLETQPSDSLGTARSMDSTEPTAATVQRFWYTKLDFADSMKMNPSFNDRSGCLSPVSEDAPRGEIDENYRQSLSDRLRPRPSDKPLPSTDFLCDIIEGRHKHEIIPIVQLALIGQMFGMLSGEPRHLAVVSACLGISISWARRADLFSLEHDTPSLQDLSVARLNEEWRNWARKEELKRAALAIFIQDAEIAALFHHEPVLRHRGNYVPAASPSDAFRATDAQSWANLMTHASTSTTLCHHAGAARPPTLGTHHPSSSCCGGVFTAYAVLEGIGASLREDRIGNLHDAASRQRHESDLMSWYRIYGGKIKAEGDLLFLMPLWHWVCMYNYVDLQQLELAIGKRGAAEASTCAAYVHEWVTSIDARRCLVHAFLVQKAFNNVSMARVFAVHVPRCLFSAAVTWSVYLSSPSTIPPTFPPLDDHSFPELILIGVKCNDQWNDAVGFRQFNHSAVKATTLCTLADMLRQNSCWGISARFSKILTPLIHGNHADSLALC